MNIANCNLSQSAWFRFVTSGVILFFAAPAFAQEDLDDESPRRPGLVATYQSASGQSCRRIDETLAFDWQAASPDPRIAPGRFSAAWQGRLWTQATGQYRLHAFVQGRVKVTLDNREVLAGESAQPQWLTSEPLDLTFDYRPLAVRFQQTAERAQLALYWSGPGFVLEPIPDRFLFHDREATIPADFVRGQRLAAALRCNACHAPEQSKQPLAAPALDRLSGNIEPAWLIDWLTQKGEAPAEPAQLVRRMPHFSLSQDEAAAVAAWLLRLPAEKLRPPDKPKETKSGDKSKTKKTEPSAAEGERLFLTLGCLACHQHGELGESGLFGGGDLTHIAAKRPAEFFARWLADPASLNRHHRMPVFDLSADERTSLSLWLAKQGSPRTAATTTSERAIEGEKLVAKHRCAACHTLPQSGPQSGPLAPRVDKAIADSPKPAPLSGSSNWSRSCAAQPDPAQTRPSYRLSQSDQTALQTYFSTDQPQREKPAPQSAGRDLLIELNCLSCHHREGIDRAANALPARLSEKLAAVVAIHDDLGKLVPAMTPPALNSVGDKLHDTPLAAAIRRQGLPHRPYLLARMPRFNLTDEQLATLVSYFTATDRVPSGAGLQPAMTAGKMPAPQLTAAGPRLVTTDGFGCTSCHQVGSVLPDKAPLNARGPTLSLLGQRIRKEWFDRWCNNPARIVPRMEMPSVQVPVRGVLGDNVHDQLAAVWHTLNTPGFEPPEPNPVRVLRLSGVPERKEAPIVLHDVIKDGDKTYLFPLVIGLPNRHNILFDLETGRLAAWWLGDTARQRTKGKSWWWEMGGKSLFLGDSNGSELSLIVLAPKLRSFSPVYGGLETRLPTKITIEGGTEVSVEFMYEFPDFNAPRVLASDKLATVSVPIRQSFRPAPGQIAKSTAFIREIEIDPPEHTTLRFDATPGDFFKFDSAEDGKSITARSSALFSIRILEPADWTISSSGTFSISKPARIVLEYVVALPGDQYLSTAPPSIPSEATAVDIAPGLIARRLPLPGEVMPTAIHALPEGELVFTTLKGEVIIAHDSDEDGLHDKAICLRDGLPTPYGVFATKNHVDVVTKSSVIRLKDSNGDGSAEQISTVASGWGVTDDYHDWAIGLVKGEAGEYFIGLPCQQDGRSEAAAKYRGQILKLVPRKDTADNPRLFAIETVSTGHRFPMGLAMNREGALFVTDNQGNYNPFNELNHVRQGAFFGFVNAIDKKNGVTLPPLVPPAIDIPHPWTRSVNGICFLETPAGLRGNRPLAERVDHIEEHSIFGPLEGHLIGCEYDTRALVRMTLQKVGESYQGAAYPLSIPPRNIEDGLLGPLVCAVSPRGELYVGNIRDSGWGAGSNVGDIVKIKIEPEKLPCGIQEVRATKDGFTIDFFRPVDPIKAADPANYAIASYRRESTPAYGGPNLDRRTEKIAAAAVSPDARRVTLKLDNLRAGYVYEFQLRPLTKGKELFHPAEAHYTLRQIPK